MAQEFFRVPDLIEKKIVTDYERKHNKKEKYAGIRITVGLTLAIAFCIYYCFFSEKSKPDEKLESAVLIIPAVVFIVVILRSVIIGQRHLKKILNGQFQIQNVKVVSKAKVPTGRLCNQITVETNEGFMFTILVDDGLSKHMPVQMEGLLVVIEGEKSHFFNDEFRFIPNSEYDDQLTPTANEFVLANEAQHERTLAYYSQALKKDKLQIVLFIAGFLAGSILILTGSFFERPVSLYFYLCGLISLFGITLLLSIKAVKQIYSGANGVLLVWGTWIFIRIFDYVPAFGLGMPDLKPLQYAAIAFGFVIDILATLFIFRDCLSLSKTIKSRSYTVSEGFIVSKDSYKKPMSYGYVTMNSVVVKNDTERTYKLENITRKEFETCYIGNPVLLIKPDKQGKETKLYLVD